MEKARLSPSMLSIILASFMLASCGQTGFETQKLDAKKQDDLAIADNSRAPSSDSEVNPIPGTDPEITHQILISGQMLYEKNCQVCHSPIGVSTKKKIDTLDNIVLSIDNAISALKPMNHLAWLNSAERRSIASALQVSDPNSGPAEPEPTSPESHELLTSFQCDVQPLVSSMGFQRLSNKMLKNSFKRSLGSLYSPMLATLSTLPSDESRDIYNSEKRYTEDVVSLLVDISAKLYVLSSTDLVFIKSIAGACFNDLNKTTDVCRDTFLAKAAQRFLSRTLTTEETQRFTGVFNAEETAGEGAAAVLSYLVLEPDFLHFVPKSNPSDNERLLQASLLLTDDQPPAALLAMASSGQLASDAGWDKALESLLTNKLAKEKFNNFIGYYLDINESSADAFSPYYGNDTTVSRIIGGGSTELQSYVDHLVFDNPQGFNELMLSRLSFATPGSTLGNLYETTGGSKPYQNGPNYQGLLLRVPFLVYGDDYTRPIIRGRKIRENILCNELGPPDLTGQEMAPKIHTKEALLAWSTRARYTLHTSAPACMACHTQLNGLGFALESYSPLGQFRTKEPILDDLGALLKEHPVDVGVSDINLSAPGAESVQNAQQLIEEITASPEAKACFQRQMFRYYCRRKENLAKNSTDSCRLKGSFLQTHSTNGKVRSGLKNLVK